MKKLFIAGLMLLGSLGCFASAKDCKSLLLEIKNSSFSAGTWDQKYRQDKADHEATDTIEVDFLQRKAALEQAEAVIKQAEAVCKKS